MLWFERCSYRKVPAELLTALLLALTMRAFVSANNRVSRTVQCRTSTKKVSPRMTREEAYSRCPADSYVEYYGSQWLIVPFEPVEQPHFFDCRPASEPAFA
jgi:hypothetical protein